MQSALVVLHEPFLKRWMILLQVPPADAILVKLALGQQNLSRFSTRDVEMMLRTVFCLAPGQKWCARQNISYWRY